MSLETAANMLLTGSAALHMNTAFNTFQAIMATFQVSLVRTFTLSHMQRTLRSRSAVDKTVVMMFPQRSVSCRLSVKNSLTRTSGESVSLMLLNALSKPYHDIVEDPEHRPLKDYIDYTKYVNNEFSK